jgi:hypothetical protein
VAEPLTSAEWKQLATLLSRYIDTEFDNWSLFRVEGTAWGTVYVSLSLEAGGDPETYALLNP